MANKPIMFRITQLAELKQAKSRFQRNFVITFGKEELHVKIYSIFLSNIQLITMPFAKKIIIILAENTWPFFKEI